MFLPLSDSPAGNKNFYLKKLEMAEEKKAIKTIFRSWYIKLCLVDDKIGASSTGNWWIKIKDVFDFWNSLFSNFSIKLFNLKNILKNKKLKNYR